MSAVPVVLVVFGNIVLLRGNEMHSNGWWRLQGAIDIAGAVIVGVARGGPKQGARFGDHGVVMVVLLRMAFLLHVGSLVGVLAGSFRVKVCDSSGSMVSRMFSRCVFPHLR